MTSTLTPDVRDPPWALGLVCRQWRSSALSLPHLWTTFDLDHLALRLDSYDDESEICASISTQLERCQDQPIKVNMGYISKMGVAEKLLSVLGSKASSWSHVVLSLTEDILDLLEPYTNMFTGLQNIHFIVDDHFPYDGLYIFRHAPALKSLSIVGRVDDCDCVTLSWKQLTRYTARDSKWSHLTNSFHFEMLPRLENLQICCLECVALDEDESAPTSPILLPALHTLTLVCAVPDREYHREGPTQLLSHVTLPGLRTLRFQNGLYNIVSPLLRLVERSGCSLRDLGLCNLDSSGSDDDDALLLMKSEAMKTVESLWIGWGNEDDELGWTGGYNSDLSRLLRALAVTKTSEGLLLSLRCLQTNNWDLDSLVAAINSRRSIIGGHAALDCLVLREHREWTLSEVQKRWADSKERLRVLAEKGLRLEWRDPDFPEV
ncbi:hypothetical protein PQX77_011231 [Marasmius sp. AFHP31]|nr:hypothetical protein PQX77_011231 [Marasmius sp. AFHP31]